MICPLCSSHMKKHLLSSTQAIVSCPQEQCIYPFNLSPDELHQRGLVVDTSEEEILQLMERKMHGAGVDSQVSRFITQQ